MALLSVLLSLLPVAAALDVCPGESARYGDHKCNHDDTHRVCATLLDDAGQPLNWGKGSFWEITGQTAWQWDDQIRANNGDSWCICMWATAELIDAAGCDNVHLHCSATDVPFVLNAYTDGGTDLDSAHKCLQRKCPDYVATQQLYAVNRELGSWAPIGLCVVAFALPARRVRDVHRGLFLA